MNFRKYLRFSLLSCLVGLTLLCIFAGYSGACARRNAMLTELLRRNEPVDISPRLERLTIRVFPGGDSPTGHYDGLDNYEVQEWNDQRPWWHFCLSWPVIEHVEIMFNKTSDNGEYEWEQGLHPLLEALDIQSATVSGLDLDDEDVSIVTKLSITKLTVWDTELLTTKSLEAIRANDRIQELDAQPARFTTAELAPLRQSRKWRSFLVPATDE